MTALPRHLSPWAAQLALFPKELAWVLGGLIHRLAPLVGGRAGTAGNRGEPDGYDGITQKGNYDRLLASDWLLLDEFPEEFIRRAVAGEHSFLRPAHLRLAEGKRCLVLFDAGPDQLGAPRLAQLALLIVLAQRAAQDGAKLEWGTFQDPRLHLHDGVTESSVRGLLRAHCLRVISSDDFGFWATKIDAERYSEVWFVGSAEVAEKGARISVSTLMIEDLLEPNGPQRLRVIGVPRGSQRAKEVVLEVPPDRHAVQLLRDPFSVAVAPTQEAPARTDVRSNLLFSVHGRRLYVRGSASSLLTWIVPNSPRAPATPAHILRAPEGHTILAVGYSSAHRRAVILSQIGDEAWVHVLSKRERSILRSERFVPRDGDALPPPREDAPLRPLGVLAKEHYVFISDAGDLLELHAGQLRLGERAGAVASRSMKEILTWVSLKDGLPYFEWAAASDSGGIAIVPWSAPPGLPAVAAGLHVHFGNALSDAFAYATSPTTWVIVAYNRCSFVSLEPERRVVGLIERSGTEREPWLVVLDATRLRLLLLRPDREELLQTFIQPIMRVEVSGTGQQIALLHDDGQLSVYALEAGGVVLRSPGDPPP